MNSGHYGDVTTVVIINTYFGVVLSVYLQYRPMSANVKEYQVSADN